jgi:flagellar motor switch protein FliG
VSPSIKSLSGPQKCAVLCLAIGPEQASDILGMLSPEELVAVTREIAAMPRVDAAVVEDVFREFESASVAPERVVEGGFATAERFLAEAMGDDRARAFLGRIQSDVAGVRLARLEPVEPRLFASILLDEHPQTTAVILAHLDPKQASRALEELPADLSSEVLYRMAGMDKIAPEVLAVLERGLRSKTDLSLSQQMAAPGSPARVARLLNMTTGGRDQRILEQIEERNGDLATRIRSLMFVFEDLLLVDGRGVQKVLGGVDGKDLALALKSASDELKAHVRGNMSERAGAALAEEIDLLGPVRVRDVEAAQQRIMDEVRRLEESGDIVVRREGSSDEFI